MVSVSLFKPAHELEDVCHDRELVRVPVARMHEEGWGDWVEKSGDWQQCTCMNHTSADRNPNKIPSIKSTVIDMKAC